MRLLDETKLWVEQEGPDAEEIRLTIDNLAFQHVSSDVVRRADLFESISFLCGLLAIDPSEVVLAEAITSKTLSEVDLAPLGVSEGGLAGKPLTGKEKADAFAALKESMKRPF